MYFTLISHLFAVPTAALDQNVGTAQRIRTPAAADPVVIDNAALLPGQ
jgi:hypothetical protein